MNTPPRSSRAIATVALVAIACAALALAGCSGVGPAPPIDAPPTEAPGPAEAQPGVAATPHPDLEVDSPAVSDSSPPAGASLTLSASVRNAGAGMSAATTLRYLLSTDATITTADTEVGTEPVASLGSSTSRRGSANVTAPANPGTHYYGACVDAVAGESDTTDNCSASVEVTVRAQPLQRSGPPDLVVDAPQVSDDTLRAAESFDLGVTVRNRGTGPAAATTLRYYRSSDATIDRGDAQVATDSVPGLTAPGTSGEAIALPAPSDAGAYHYGACVDAVSTESDSGNNCSPAVRVTVQGEEVPDPDQGPDLVVESPSVSDSTPNPGEYFEFQATIRNRGDEASAATTFRYYKVYGHEDTISYENDKYPLVTPSVPGLEPGESVLVRAGSAAPVTPNKYWHYGGCLDAVAGETDTGNNCSTLLKVITEPAEPGQPIPLPDLVVESPSVSDSTPYVGETFEFEVTVRNQGGNPSDWSNLYLLRSSDATISWTDTKVWRIGMTGISASKSTHVKPKPVTAPSSAGTYYYGACVKISEYSDVIESNTDNNCSSAVQVTVQAAPPGKPDLVVESPSVVGKTPNEYGNYFVKKGEAFSMQATVRNQGTGSSAATTLRFYRSQDRNDLREYMDERGSATVSGLSASGAEVVSAQLLRWYRTASYYYGACVDPPADEAVTGNNCSPGILLRLVE